MRSPSQLLTWPHRRQTWLAILLVCALLPLVIAIFLIPSPLVPAPTDTTDRWASESALFAGSAYIFAAAATLLASLAYINATEKPILVIKKIDFGGRGAPLGRDSTRPVPWNLTLVLGNDGQVAARYVAVRVKLMNANFEPNSDAIRAGWRFDDPETYGTASEIRSATWDGGVDVVIHQNWPFPIPALTPVRIAPINSGPLTFIVEVVADDFPSRATSFAIL